MEVQFFYIFHSHTCVAAEDHEMRLAILEEDYKTSTSTRQSSVDLPIWANPPGWLLDERHPAPKRNSAPSASR
ncbi:hypothetical protein, partial [Burkholderia gladioli]|uniref:hypothetical protein n=1 Tax=Burkholderia gladioli TaxID=28095 RepID=UPI003F7B19D4